jgi:hypothetical protein
MTPLAFLAATLGITIGAWVTHGFLRRRSTTELRDLAHRYQAHYAATDRFGILPHVLERFPIPGAANLAVFDVLYGQDHDRYRYIFTIEFTLGVILQKRRLRRAGLLSETRESRGGEGWSNLTLAPEEFSLLKQYEALHLQSIAPRITTPPASAAANPSAPVAPPI